MNREHQEEAITVKPLVWTFERRHGLDVHTGQGLGLKYEAAPKVSSPGWVVVFGRSEVIFDSDDEGEVSAKAAAQADYKKRLLSEIDSFPIYAPTEEAVERALKAFHGSRKHTSNRAAMYSALLAAFPHMGEEKCARKTNNPGEARRAR